MTLYILCQPKAFFWIFKRLQQVDMPALVCHHVGMVESLHAQYTLRGIPRALDRALRDLAKLKNKSLNATLLEIITTQLGESKKPQLNHNLDNFIGTWVNDPATDKALKEQREILPGDWA